MEAIDYIERVRAAGFDLAADGGRLLVFPVDRLSDQQRQFLRAHKSEILAALRASKSLIDAEGGHDLGVANDADCLPPRLVEAATRVCREVHGDNDAQVEGMLYDLRHSPPSDWSALTEHFESQLPPINEPGRERISLQAAGYAFKMDVPTAHVAALIARASVRFTLKKNGGGGPVLGEPGMPRETLVAGLHVRYGDRLATIDGEDQ